MLEGLAGWVSGEVLALLIWTALASFVAALFWVAMIVWSRGQMPMRTYRTPDGARHTGALTWLLVFVAVLSCLPVALLAYHYLAAAFWATAPTVLWFIDHWPLWLALALAYGGWRGYVQGSRLLAARRAAADAVRQEMEHAPALAHDPIPHGEARTGLPVGVNRDGSLVYVQPEQEYTPTAGYDFFARPPQG